MLACITSHAPWGLEGEIVSVEVDIRNGFPMVEIVGLPDSAVRESRERVRIAIKNSGFEFPMERITVGLAPAGIPKQGTSFDLPIALGILCASEQAPAPGDGGAMVLGELALSGAVRPVRGVLSAVASGLLRGIRTFFVPRENVPEAEVLGRGDVRGIERLSEIPPLLALLAAGTLEPAERSGARRPPPVEPCGDLADIRGHQRLKRALEIAAAGRHHLLVVGPPGSGKTMALRRLPGLLPPLAWEDALTVTRIHSLAGVLDPSVGLLTRSPFRMPHHSASAEGIVGGGASPRPGEISLAHGGVLFLDEAPEFRSAILQALREPIEDGRITIARAASSVAYPADFQLVLAANPCPCGPAGDGGCVCSRVEIDAYWRRVGGALLDRIDIRLSVDPVPAAGMVGPPGEPTAVVAARVAAAVEVQRRRYAGEAFGRNAAIPPGLMPRYCSLEGEVATAFVDLTRRHGVSSRGCHSILRVARTIADLAGRERIGERELLDATRLRANRRLPFAG